MIITIEITDTNHLKGITLAREAYNKSIQQEFKQVQKQRTVNRRVTKEIAPGEFKDFFEDTVETYMDSVPVPLEQNSKYLKTDQDYIKFVISKACESYAKQHGVIK